jgi:hypothetical protein
MNSHLRVDRYGDFLLTDAVRPSLDVRIVPAEGYRVGIYRDPAADLRVPVLAAAVSCERLFDAFLSLLEPLGPVVNAVLETSHDSEGASHRDLFRSEVDLPVLESYFCEFEQLLTHDGCTGVAVISAEAPIEVQFDEHKLLTIYASDLRPFERLLRESGVARNDRIRFITEDEHLHTSKPRYAEEFQQLACRLGVGRMAEHVSW